MILKALYSIAKVTFDKYTYDICCTAHVLNKSKNSTFNTSSFKKCYEMTYVYNVACPLITVSVL